MNIKLRDYFESIVTFEEEFFIISDLNDQRNFESILQPFSEEERKKMSKMHSIRRRALNEKLYSKNTNSKNTSSSVKEERLSLFVVIQNPIEISMREEDSSSQKMMRLLTSQSFHPKEKKINKLSRGKYMNLARSSGVILEQPN